MKLEYKKMQLKIVQNERATYSFAELNEYIDWDVKRVYYIQNCLADTNTHCHKIEKEVFIMVKGSCVATIDWGEGIKEVLMQSPGDAVYLGNYVWHGFKDFTPDAVLLALSSTNYNSDRSDYIEDYREYLAERAKL